MKVKSNRNQLIKLFQISLLFIIFTTTINSQKVDFDTIQALIQEYNDSSNTILKSVLKTGLVESLEKGIDLIKADSKIYFGEIKEKIDEVETYLKKFNLTNSIDEQKIYLDLILANAKIIWKNNVSVDKDELQQRLKEILHRAFEEIQKSQKGMGDVSYDENFLKDIDITIGENTKKSSIKPVNQPNPSQPPFPLFHVIGITTIVVIIFLFVFFLIKRRKRNSTNNLGYNRQVESY